MALSFFSSVTLRDRRKTFVRPVESAQDAEPLITVLPRMPFRQSLRSKKHASVTEGQRVVLVSLTADGWIYSGFKGTVLSLETEQDRKGRAVQKARVAWDEGDQHPARISVSAISRLRPEQ
jgi:hypothetical protein